MIASLRDQLARYLPSWLGDNYPDGPSFGFRLLSVMALLVELGVDTAIEGSAAALARGTPSALPYIGQARGLMRWQNETDNEYALRLRGWLDAMKEAGSERALAKQLHGYFASRPKVEIISRSGRVVTCDVNGTVSVSTITWNWDGTSNPERVGYWSDLWIVVYTTQFTNVGVWGTSDGQLWGADGGFGSSNTAQEFDAIQQLVAQWKGAHTLVRCLIVNRNNTRPVPDGTWGTWHVASTGAVGARDTINNFFWEFS